MKFLKTLQLARSLFSTARHARKDDEISEAEALQLVSEAFAFANEVIGEVKLTSSVKNLVRSMATEVLRRVCPITDEQDLYHAKECYHAYAAAVDFKSFDGKPLKAWDE